MSPSTLENVGAPCGRDAPLWGEYDTKMVRFLEEEMGVRGRTKHIRMGRGLVGEGIERNVATPWGWGWGRRCLSLMGLGAGVGRSGRKRWGWGFASRCSQGQDAVGGLNASRTTGTRARELTTRSSLESDSELESSALSRSR